MLKISPSLTFPFTAEDLEDLGEIGQGAYGTVNKMMHRTKLTVMAVKRIQSSMDPNEERKLLTDLDVIMKSEHCDYIVRFYGAIFKEVIYFFIFYLFFN